MRRRSPRSPRSRRPTGAWRGRTSPCGRRRARRASPRCRAGRLRRRATRTGPSTAFAHGRLAVGARGGPADLVHAGPVGGHALFPDGSVYCATKAAVAHLTRDPRAGLGPRGVRVKNIEPGVTGTEPGRTCRTSGCARPCPACPPAWGPGRRGRHRGHRLRGVGAAARQCRGDGRGTGAAGMIGRAPTGRE
ncbi:SDR family NAD(P)-dependent oxidoreductase [Streptomyces coeruleorubidus]|uniref:SDR family NAD(P)-dependent oxidoreductase n=1 Tax=Streptomyces coeruleorubidus TaxID=116188 RepID=UPI00368A7703